MYKEYSNYYYLFFKNRKVYNLSLFIILFLFFIFPKNTLAQCPPSTTRLYVNKNVTTQGNGTSWVNAFTEFREALLLAHDCPDIVEIWVAEGTYTPTATENRITFFVMRNDLAWYGGFGGTENNLSERDWSAHPTILSGDLLGDDDYTTLPPTNNDENSFHVIFNFFNNIDSSAILDGFHIIGGNANIDPPNHVGGGLYNKQASPTVANCTFYGNNGGYGGGGNYNDLSTISLDNCIFYNNTGTFRGGGMYSDASEMVLNNCTFFNNHTITPDSAVGGAMFNNFSSPRITNCSFLNNSSSHGGDAISNNAWSKPFIHNSIFWGNGDEIVNTSSNPNFAPPEENSNCVVNIQNCIIQNSNGSGSTWNLFYGIDNGGNLDIDPLFIDEIFGDLRLMECSPAMNSGDNLLVPQELLIDLDGNDRIFDFANGGVVDMGAFEFQTNCCTVGDPCDDNDACTTGETIQDNCECGGGILTDLDDDNICDSDSLDNCIGPNIGDPCDDNDACTTGETMQNNCECGGGILTDLDGDNICDSDSLDNCIGPNIGDPCDDNDACTTDETVQNDCECGGGILTDLDEDNICDSDPLDNCIGPNIGDDCDDGNPETENDMINADCICDGVVNNFDLEKEKLLLHFFPNPVNDFLFLEIKNAPNQNVEIQIFNQIGQSLDVRYIDFSNSSPIIFDVQNYAPGIYFIQIELKNKQTLSRKFVIL
ncbi:MAG: T9SS type A sorting domain-containing protein [Saprospiraceae bacterium]